MAECALHILANKWRLLHRPFDVTPQLHDSLVKACCIVHNFDRPNDGFQLQDICMKVISKAFVLQGQEETPGESM